MGKIKIKIFEGSNNETAQINKWLNKNPNVDIVKITTIPMHDLFLNGDICNQWVNTIIVFKCS